MNMEENTLKSEYLYKGKILDLELMEVQLPNGKKALREIIRHKGACAVIPVDKDGDVFMVTQYRKPFDVVSLEIPGGKLDEGEEPICCAHRELKEETGLTAGNIEYLMRLHTTPGFCDEVIHIYLATNLSEGDISLDEDEFLKVEKYSMEILIEKILSGEINDGKTIAAILMAERILKNSK